MSSRVGRNIVANGIGRLSSLVSNFIFVPLYIRLMGGESYGLVIAYATLVASLQVLDAGWSNLLSRQLALRLGNGDGAPVYGSSINLARTIEVISWVTGMAVGGSMIVFAPYIANSWLMTQALPRPETIEALRLIGAVLAVQWPSMAYQGAIIGLQEQVRLNVVRISVSTVQAAGAALVLWQVSATAHAYFLWVLLVQAINTVWMRRIMWAKLGVEKHTPPRFDWGELSSSWRFALGVAGIALLASFLTQADKIVLSRNVALSEFGVYGVAFMVCGILNVIAGPVLQALLPRFAQLSAFSDDKALRDIYLRGCELTALLVVPAWMVLSFHSQQLTFAWMGSGTEAQAVAILLPVLGLGTLFNAIVTLPYGLQIAVGWTSLSVLKNIVAVALSFPALLWAVGKFGAMGAAAVWVAINAGYVLFEIPIMHTRLLKGMAPTWYLHAVIAPIGVGIIVGYLSRQVHVSPSTNRLEVAASLGLWFAIMVLVLAAVLPSVRKELWRRLGHRAHAGG